MKMVCKFTYEGCPADCAHREPHDEIVHDDFGEDSPCVLPGDCGQCGVPSYCVPVVEPNRVVIEMDDSGPVCVRAARPDEAVVIIRHIAPRFGDGQLVYGDGGLPVEPLAVVGEGGEARFEVGL